MEDLGDGKAGRCGWEHLCSKIKTLVTPSSPVPPLSALEILVGYIQNSIWTPCEEVVVVIPLNKV
jgi:hypothetical protein